MNETGSRQGLVLASIVNCCAAEHTSEDELQTTDHETIPVRVCPARCGGLLATRAKYWTAIGSSDNVVLLNTD